MKTIESTVKERGILMSAPMVRAILDGRKTQTRRIVKFKGEMPIFCGDLREADRSDPDEWGWDYIGSDGDPVCVGSLPCPYGKVGDRLWVRECWALLIAWDCESGVDEWKDPMPKNAPAGFRQDGWGKWGAAYRADGNWESHKEDRGFDWRPSLFMPRWASRITLEITDIRVERLADISEEDAIAEGLVKITKDGGRTWKYGIPDADGLPGGVGWAWKDWQESPRDAYRTLWNSINGDHSWDLNPWAWVVAFRRIEETQ